MAADVVKPNPVMTVVDAVMTIQQVTNNKS
jgi:hypothetical protein